MKRTLLYIQLILLALTSCQSELPVPEQGNCYLELNLSRVGVAKRQTRAIDNDLALKILDNKGEIYVQYRAGNVPNKLVLSPGIFTVIAYTENQDDWTKANDGRGEASYYGSCQVEMAFDQTTYANLQVPMTNYAVSLALPEYFHDFFPSYTFSLNSGERHTKVKEGEKAYFDAEEGGFTYQLTATNTDQITHHTTPITYKKVESGKLYQMTYYYGTDDNSGGLDIEITDNTEKEDQKVPL
ncbi:MAG: DUF4493 domain-containing protein [Bacteroidaceae bacterium]|nr:DUF4493 domain-containing protein [Bacteroidaceae bacterium]